MSAPVTQGCHNNYEICLFSLKGCAVTNASGRETLEPFMSAIYRLELTDVGHIASL